MCAALIIGTKIKKEENNFKKYTDYYIKLLVQTLEVL